MRLIVAQVNGEASENTEDKPQTNPEDPEIREAEGACLERGLEEEEEEEASWAEDDAVLGARRNSEPDLTKIPASGPGPGPGEEAEAEGGGDGDSFELLHSAIQAGTLPILHGSCPDLSAAQRGLLDELLWDVDEEEEAVHQVHHAQSRFPPLLDAYDTDTDTEVVMARMQRSLAEANAHLAPITVVDPDSDYELSSGPVFNALENAFSHGLRPTQPSLVDIIWCREDSICCGEGPGP